MQTPQQVADNWKKGMTGAGDKLRAGINAVTEAPTEKAARRVQAQVDGVARAAASGKTERALRRVTLEDWKKAALEKGVNRVAAGAAAAQPKFASFMEEFLPHVQAGMNKLASMPRGDLEQNIGRAVEMMRHNSTFRRQR